jgi:outer membrane protein OmpA-like peptidoglycan-associated protein
MKIWKTIPFAAALVVAQAHAPFTTHSYKPISNPNPTPQTSPSAVPLYRVTVVQGSTKAINYRNLKFSAAVDLKGTALAPDASGQATLKNQDGTIHITAKFKNLPPASNFGGEYLTYVLWGISPEGRPTNLGELILKHGKARVKVTEQLQSFGLLVTAEPYFAVSQPSDVVVLENAIRKGASTPVEYIDTKFELLKRGQYNQNLAATDPIIMNGKIPFAVYQARNAVRIAQSSGASTYAPEAFKKAQDYLKQAETDEGGQKGKTFMARDAVQRAEDARLISVQRQEALHVAMERKLAQDRVDSARNEATKAAVAKDAAQEQAKQAETENEALRSKNEGLRARNEGLQSKNEGLQSKNEGLRARNQGLRSDLMEQLNSILQTRATARGLIVNMSGVLFQNGKATLLPAAREKLSKIAGILSTHKGLKIEADGYTDSNGSDESNQHLSEQRAENTKNYLVSQGVSADSISFKGFGEESPIASNATDAGRQENRRVELVVSGEGITPQ